MFSLDTLKSLIEINTKINSTNSDINALLIYILKSAMRLFQCEASLIFLVQEENFRLKLDVSFGIKNIDEKDTVFKTQGIAGWVVENSTPIIVNNAQSDFRFSKEIQDKIGIKIQSVVAFPIYTDDKCCGVVELINKTSSVGFTSDDLEILKILSEQIALVYKDINYTFIAKSPAILDLVHIIEGVATTNSPVLLIGESGVGKSFWAEQLHLKSCRKYKPFIKIGCDSVASSLLDEQLFGCLNGVCAGHLQQENSFLLATGGTLFFDKIEALSLEMQEKLLKVLQTKKFETSDAKTITVDVRFVFSTKVDLEEMVKDGTFNSNLYYRLSMLALKVPTLRERKVDIETLSVYFLKKFAEVTKKGFIGFSSLAIKSLCNYYWPNNIRELENTIERACIFGTPPYIQVADLRLPEVLNQGSMHSSDIDGEKTIDGVIKRIDSLQSEDLTLKTAINRFKKAYLCKILDLTSWNQTQTAKILEVQRTYVSRLLNELNIRDERNKMR